MITFRQWTSPDQAPGRAGLRRLLDYLLGGPDHPEPLLRRRRVWFLIATWGFALSPLVAWLLSDREDGTPIAPSTPPPAAPVTEVETGIGGSPTPSARVGAGSRSDIDVPVTLGPPSSDEVSSVSSRPG